jgi:hypothetical protein
MAVEAEQDVEAVSGTARSSTVVVKQQMFAGPTSCTVFHRQAVADHSG